MFKAEQRAFACAGAQGKAAAADVGAALRRTMVNRAARMMSAAFGGQVLAERSLIDDTLAHWVHRVPPPLGRTVVGVDKVRRALAHQHGCFATVGNDGGDDGDSTLCSLDIDHMV